MKALNITAIVTLIITLISCGGSVKDQVANADGFAVIEKEIKSEFGEDSYFTDLSITYNKSIGNIIGVTFTNAPESFKMEKWNSVQGVWTQDSDISLEVPEGYKAADFMFQLGKDISLSKLGELVEKSKAKLTEEKGLENPTLSMAFVKFPKHGDLSKTEYSITLKPENGGTSFSFYYNLSGELNEMDY